MNLFNFIHTKGTVRKNIFVSKSQNMPATFFEIVGLPFVFRSDFRFTMPIQPIAKYYNWFVVDFKVNYPSVIHRILFRVWYRKLLEYLSHLYFYIRSFNPSAMYMNCPACLRANIVVTYPARLKIQSFITNYTIHYFLWFIIRVMDTNIFASAINGYTTSAAKRGIRFALYFVHGFERLITLLAISLFKLWHVSISKLPDVLASSRTIPGITIYMTLGYISFITTYFTDYIYAYHKLIITRQAW